jgi:shikimate dehydrogenase
MPIDGKTKIAGVIGFPVKHSLSPFMHNYWLDQYNINGAYIPLGVEPENFADVFRALKTCGFLGFNVTIPHKEIALKLCDEVDPEAARIGAVNTVVFRNGRAEGYNTDVEGFIKGLQINNVDMRGKRTVVIGAGGAARAVCAALESLEVAGLVICNRDTNKASEMAGFLKTPHNIINYQELDTFLESASLVVNTTPLGMNGNPELVINQQITPPECAFYDLIYNPLQTGFLKTAESLGRKTINGLDMLIHQAIPGFQMWFGESPQVTEEFRELMVGKVKLG